MDEIAGERVTILTSRNLSLSGEAQAEKKIMKQHKYRLYGELRILSSPLCFLTEAFFRQALRHGISP